MGLGWLINAYSSHSIHNAKEVGPQITKGSFPAMQGGRFPRCKVVVWLSLCIPLLLGLWVSATQLCCDGSRQ